MIKHFITLEWKQFLRASYFQKGIVVKIFLILGALYFGGIALFLGVGLFFIAKKALPETDPVVTINNFIIYWFLFEILLRYFMQQLPVMNVKPLMVIPVKRDAVIHYLLGKTMLSFFNFLALFLFLPFSIVLLVNGYPVVNVVFWFLAVLFITWSINFLNFLVNKSNIGFYITAVLLLSLIGLEYYGIYAASEPIGFAFNTLYNNPYLAGVPALLLVFLYTLNFNFIKKGFYLDGVISRKIETVRTTDLSWFNRFGSVAPFIKNDIKLIWRNARPKQVLKMSVLFLFYGLVFFPQDTYKDTPAILAFASIFVTGGFLLTFGQLVPSWDSEYYKMMMSQNISYRKYLESKWYLMIFAVAISFILSTPYIYFGWEIYALIAAGASFNIGLNSFITLFGGALNRMPVELNAKAKAFSNTNGFNPTQLLIALPKMVLPMLLFYVPYKLVNYQTGILVLGLSGILGLILRNFFLRKIEIIYQKGKYKTIAAFAEKN
ncbi:DUF5687 family protein [Bizionia sediminis]|uniref:DUF5687 family protein n=1 Tax=Bizionia sediminis TaxID=1737064 RepID=A0ABW5KT84_9FLAO